MIPASSRRAPPPRARSTSIPAPPGPVFRGRPLTSYQVVPETIAATTTRTVLTIGATLDAGSYDLGISVTPAEFHALPITPNTFHGNWNYTLSLVPPRAPDAPATAHRTDPALTAMLTDPALIGMSRTAFEQLVTVSEPFWDALAEAAFPRRFHRPRSYRHPQTSSMDHTPTGSWQPSSAVAER